MTDLPTLKIFLSSPGDVAEERALAEFVFRRLANEVADAVRLVVVMWEHEPLFGHTGFQQQIERPSQSDLVVTILWSRLGSRLPSDFAPAPGVPAPTGTEFEINDALTSYAECGRPNLLIYRKIPGPQIGLGSVHFAERTEQFNQLDEFCRRTFYDAEGAIVVAHHTYADSHEFERRLAEHVGRWLERSVHLPHSEFRPFWRGQSPFRGLQAFEAEHQTVYFGRSEAMGDLMRRIRDTEAVAASEPVARVLLVQGMSGAGKTSLFKAGLLPLLALRPVEGIAQWLTINLRPSESDPTMRDFGALGVLASRLFERIPEIMRSGNTVPELAEALATRPQATAAKIESWIATESGIAGIEPGRVRLIIYVDQLEEAFANPDSSPGEGSFIHALVELARSGSIWIAATLRSDFAHRLEAYPELMKSMSRSPPYTLLPPRPDQLAEMIREPAKAAGLIWEERDGVTLDQELLRDAAGNPEALPLLEYTLAELYERRERRVLRWSQYGGGLKGALICAADEVVSGADGDVETAFRDVMRELVSVGEDGAATRRYASLARFPPGTDARALLDGLIARRLCVTNDEGRGDGPVASLAHEALIRSWPRAQEWLQRETSLLRLRDELARDAAVWDYHQRLDDWLAVAPEKLVAIRQITEAGLMPAGAAADYARLSRRRGARNKAIRRAAFTGICMLTVIAAVAWWLALKQRDLARIEAATSDRTKQFMVSLFQLADPTESRGNSVTVKEVLDKGAAEIRSDHGVNSLSGEPRVRAELLTAMGQAYSGLGLYKPAEELLKKALVDQDLTSIPDESRVRTLVANGSTLYLAGKYDEAANVLQTAVDTARAKLSRSSSSRSQALTQMALVLMQIEKFPEAIRLCQEALAADRKRVPPNLVVLAHTLGVLGSAYFYSGDLRAAESPMRESLNLYNATYGAHHALTAHSLNDLGALLYQSGRYEEASAMLKRALPVYREIYGDEHPEVASINNNIGRAALVMGHVDEAEPILRQSLAMLQKFEGDTYDGLVSPLNSLAMIDAYEGRLAVAQSEIQRAESIARMPDHGELLDQVLLNEADIDLAANQYERASSLLEESKLALQKSHPDARDDAWRYAVWDSVNAQLLASKGETARAAATLAKAQSVLVNRFGVNGFYCTIAKRRMALIAHAKRASTLSAAD
jgi:tetratricopeptide (TPR) repeat protein